jgi:hypothetical protein
MTAAPSSLPLVQPYFAAWTARDPEAVAAAFTEGGTYPRPDGHWAAAHWCRHHRAGTSHLLPGPEL